MTQKTRGSKAKPRLMFVGKFADYGREEDFRRLGLCLGFAAAASGAEIVVGSDSPSTLDANVVRGAAMYGRETGKPVSWRVYAPDRKALKRTRWPLLRRAWNLKDLDICKLATLTRVNRRLFRAYLLKESLAAILDGKQVHVARRKLHEWIGWAFRSQLVPFRRLAATIRNHQDGILAYVWSRLSNARTEALNGKARTITLRSYGLHSASALIALLKLCCSGIELEPVTRRPRTTH